MLSRAIYHETGPTAIRYPRGGEGDFQENTAVDDWACLRQGTEAVILSYGIQINQAVRAAELCEERGKAVAVYKLNRLSGQVPAELLMELAAYPQILVCEDVAASGSMGEVFAAAFAAHGMQISMLFRNTGNRFLPHGDVPALLRMCGLDAQSLADALCGENPKEEGNG